MRMFFCILAATAVISRAQTCPDDTWEAVKGSCYKFPSGRYSFDECAAVCSPGQLACVQTCSENDYIQKHNNGKGIMIGITDSSKEGNWEWVTCEDKNDFTNWHGGEPNDYNGAEDCAVLLGPNNPWDFGEDLQGPRWVDVGCDDESGENTGSGYVGGWTCACEFNPDGSKFHDENPKSWTVNYALFIVISVVAALVVLGLSLSAKVVPRVNKTLLVLSVVGAIFLMMGAAMVAAFYGQLLGVTCEGSCGCESTGTLIAGYVFLGLGGLECVITMGLWLCGVGFVKGGSLLRAGRTGGTWTEHRDIDMCNQGDAEIIHGWRERFSIEELKRMVEEKGYSGFTVSSGEPSFGHAALKDFSFQLTPGHCKPITMCCNHPCTIYIYTPPLLKCASASCQYEAHQHRADWNGNGTYCCKACMDQQGRRHGMRCTQTPWTNPSLSHGVEMGSISAPQQRVAEVSVLSAEIVYATVVSGGEGSGSHAVMTASVASGGGGSLTERLRQLECARKAGLLSDAEHADAKRRLLTELAGENAR